MKGEFKNAACQECENPNCKDFGMRSREFTPPKPLAKSSVSGRTILLGWLSFSLKLCGFGVFGMMDWAVIWVLLAMVTLVTTVVWALFSDDVEKGGGHVS